MPNLLRISAWSSGVLLTTGCVFWLATGSQRERIEGLDKTDACVEEVIDKHPLMSTIASSIKSCGTVDFISAPDYGVSFEWRRRQSSKMWPATATEQHFDCAIIVQSPTRPCRLFSPFCDEGTDEYFLICNGSNRVVDYFGGTVWGGRWP